MRVAAFVFLVFALAVSPTRGSAQSAASTPPAPTAAADSAAIRRAALDYIEGWYTGVNVLWDVRPEDRPRPDDVPRERPSR